MYIAIRFSDAHEYFLQRLKPENLLPRYWEIVAWLDSWLNWLVGTERVDVSYKGFVYEWHTQATARLLDFDIPHRVVDEHGDEIEVEAE